jgi:hypothetical protein
MCTNPTLIGVTIRCNRHAPDSNRVNAANTARSAQDSRGLLTWRRNTATSWRSTRISAFFDFALRASSPSQARICRKIRYSSRSATADDHARRSPSTDAAGHRCGRPVRHPQVQVVQVRDRRFEPAPIHGASRDQRVQRMSKLEGVGRGRAPMGYPFQECADGVGLRGCDATYGCSRVMTSTSSPICDTPGGGPRLARK